MYARRTPVSPARGIPHFARPGMAYNTARRPRSLALSFTDAATEDGPILRTEVLNALIEAGIPKEDVEGIEAPQRNKYFVVMKSFLARRANMNKKITIREKIFFLSHPNPSQYRSPKIRLRIYNYPLDEETENLETVLEHYASFRKGSLKDLEDRTCGIKNGVKEVYVHIKKAIPSYVYVGKNLVRFDYTGQRATCRKCHQTGHIARECTTAVTCRGCGAADHEMGGCPNVICFRCGKQGHTNANCYEEDYENEFPDMNAGNGNNETPENKENEKEQQTEGDEKEKEKKENEEKEKGEPEKEKEKGRNEEEEPAREEKETTEKGNETVEGMEEEMLENPEKENGKENEENKEETPEMETENPKETDKEPEPKSPPENDKEEKEEGGKTNDEEEEDEGGEQSHKPFKIPLPKITECENEKMETYPTKTTKESEPGPEKEIEEESSDHSTTVDTDNEWTTVGDTRNRKRRRKKDIENAVSKGKSRQVMNPSKKRPTTNK